MQLDQALLLAAGEGSRLRPLTDHVPKPMLPIDGQPVVGTLLDQLVGAGIRSLVIVLSPTGAMLRQFAEQAAPGDVTVAFVEQPSATGTADAIQRGLERLDRTRPSVIAACDTVWQEGDIERVVQCHRELAPMVTMAARRWPLEQLPHRSCLTLDARGRVERVIEKPRADEVTSALSGSPLYAVDPAFWRYVDAVQPSASGKLELATALQSAIDDGHAVQSLEVAQTRDLTRPADLLRHNFPYLAQLLPELAPT